MNIGNIMKPYKQVASQNITESSSLPREVIHGFREDIPRHPYHFRSFAMIHFDLYKLLITLNIYNLSTAEAKKYGYAYFFLDKG